jgi:hypothetical protein
MITATWPTESIRRANVTVAKPIKEAPELLRAPP